MKAIFRQPAMLISLLLAGCATRPPLATVPFVDLNRYGGLWYEIAKYPNWFQAKCAGDTTAEYSAGPQGSILVLNRCHRANGAPCQVQGRATVVPGSGNAKLRVRFPGSPFAGDYWIIGLDEKNYTWAVVGHPSRQFLWILARQPQISAQIEESIFSLVEKQGYSRNRIVPTAQNTLYKVCKP